MSEIIAFNLLQARIRNGLSIESAASLPIIQKFKDSPRLRELLKPKPIQEEPQITSLQTMHQARKSAPNSKSVKITVRIPTHIYEKIQSQKIGIATFINQLLYNHFNKGSNQND